ncbi:MAG: dicarboxylate/amino acid:cation symporter [Bacteroidetes bacterium]|nr:dicarboxylate/amino acid:cation symporter [Bacteroidota bacterium]HET6245031.1 dicarboxylate/amino acid:cation symporter [Bacteroidia bacterium]
MKRKMALHWKIIIGLVLGAIWGVIAGETGLVEFNSNWIAPFGTIFINLLKLIAVPLVLVSLITGISGLKDVAGLSRMGSKTVAMYLFTTVVAITIGLTAVNLIRPGHYFSEQKREEFKQMYGPRVEATQAIAGDVNTRGPLQFLVDIVPSNLFLALQDNTRLLQVIFFALLFGIALISIPGESTTVVKAFFKGTNEVILKIVDLVMVIAPYGVFALISAIVADFAGQIGELMQALGLYSLTVLLGLAIMAFLVYPGLMMIFTKMSYKKFFLGISPAQLLAFSTSSSAATLPVTMERVEEKLGVSEEVTSFVLPLGATINMDGTSLYQAVAVVFIAQAFGYDLTIAQQLTIVLMATLSSIGAAPVPGAGMVMLIIILQSVGIDPEGLALIVAVDRILDMCRTVVNVTGDASVAVIVASSENQLKDIP